MGIFSIFNRKKKKPALDGLEEIGFFKRQKAVSEAFNEMGQSGCDADEIPGGQGEFGYNINNPIPTNTIMGSRSYLAQLRTPDGEKVVYERLCSSVAIGSSSIIDVYEVSRPNGEKLATIYISPYNKKNSKKAPKGFTLL